MGHPHPVVQMGLCDPLTEGYAAHLAKLSAPGGSVPAQGNARMVIPRSATPWLSLRRRSQAKLYFSEPVLGCPDSFNTSQCHCAIAPSSLCGPTQKSKNNIEEEFQRD